jgi:hypothetical protein
LACPGNLERENLYIIFTNALLAGERGGLSEMEIRIRSIFISCLLSFVIGSVCCGLICWRINRGRGRTNPGIEQIEFERRQNYARNRREYFERNRELEGISEEVENEVDVIESGIVSNAERAGRIQSRCEEIESIIQAAENRPDGD